MVPLESRLVNKGWLEAKVYMQNESDGQSTEIDSMESEDKMKVDQISKKFKHNGASSKRARLEFTYTIAALEQPRNS